MELCYRLARRARSRTVIPQLSLLLMRRMAVVEEGEVAMTVNNEVVGPINEIAVQVAGGVNRAAMMLKLGDQQR